MYIGKDDLQNYLIAQCRLHEWIKKQVAKKVEGVDKINTLSINSVRQRLK